MITSTLPCADRPQEHIRRVLDPSTRIRGFMGACYWCSGPSDDEDSTETLDFKLAHPLCVVRQIIVQPFRAAFQLVSSLPVFLLLTSLVKHVIIAV